MNASLRSPHFTRCRPQPRRGGRAWHFVSLLTCLGLVAPVSAPSDGRWKAGVHYEVLPAEKAIAGRHGKVRVLEFFSYPCGSCYVLEPQLVIWRQSRAQQVELVAIPVVYLPQARAYARLHYTLQAMGRPDLYHEIYDSIHRAARPLYAESERKTLELQLGFARAHGVEAPQFMKAYTSKAVEDALRNADILTRLYLVEGTPTLIVAGRYKSMAGQAGGYEKLIALVDDLVSAEYRRCCADRGEVK